jgi:hypothetical protein
MSLLKLRLTGLTGAERSDRAVPMLLLEKLSRLLVTCNADHSVC